MWSISKFIFAWQCWLSHTNKEITAAPVPPHALCAAVHCVLLCLVAWIWLYGSKVADVASTNNTEWVRSRHCMGTRSPFKHTRLHWLFRVTIDFLTKAMTSLISPLVYHLTQMGSLAAGSDNNSNGYESEIVWIKHSVQLISQQICITPKLEKVEELLHSTIFKQNHYACKKINKLMATLPPRLSVHKHKQTSSVNSPFIVQFKLNLWKMREKSTDRFSAGFQNKNNNERRIIFSLIRGQQLS